MAMSGQHQSGELLTLSKQGVEVQKSPSEPVPCLLSAAVTGNG